MRKFGEGFRGGSMLCDFSISFIFFVFVLFIYCYFSAHSLVFFFVRFFCMRVKKKEKAEIIVVLNHSL